MNAQDRIKQLHIGWRQTQVWKLIHHLVEMSARRNRRRSSATAVTSSPACETALSPAPVSLLSPRKNSGDVSDLRSWLSSRIEGLRSDAEQIHSGFVKELEASTGRLKKRMKLEVEASNRHTEETSRAWKSFAADVEEDLQEVQGTCKELIARVQAASSKSSCLAELLKSAESHLEGLRAKYVRT